MNIRYNTQYERQFIRLMTARKIDCHRVAGSGVASEAVCDCIMFYGQKTYLVEVKATKEKMLYMRKRVKEQLQKMIAVCERNSLIPLLAIKFKHRGWNLIKIKELVSIEFNKEVIFNDSGTDIIFA